MRRLAVFVLVGLLLSCSGAKMVKDSTMKCFPLKMDGDQYREAKADGIKITEINIEGSCMTINYELKNACEETDLDLHWDYRVKKSMPPQATLKLNLSGKLGCGVSLSGKKKFDLKELTNPAYKGKIYLWIPPYEEKVLFEYAAQQ